MRYFAGIVSIAFLICGGAHASEQSALKDTAAALRAAPQRTEGKPVRARSASAWGLDWSAANLLEKAVAERPTPQARFNLAATYARTGRYEAAAALYRGLVVDGRFTQGALDPSYITPGLPSRGFNLAVESAERLALLESIMGKTGAGETSTASPTSPPAPFAAAEAGVNAAAVEGVARISDEQAIERDTQIVAARNPGILQQAASR
ncbi:MAG TPA: hypothetical protein VL460_00435 [Caulobacteraceae bacterium]|jgi:hypothetical protein|nr:hypothetical protein [Caulobacteraceae bacterium]